MITWNTEIINRLKTGSIKSVLLFGDSMNRPAPPYIVVKPMASGDRKLLQIIVHGALGTQDTLEAYILRELPALFTDHLVVSGKVIHVRSTGGWIGPYTDEGDNTLAMSRDFYVPLIL
jgi:hypothetical protein